MSNKAKLILAKGVLFIASLVILGVMFFVAFLEEGWTGVWLVFGILVGVGLVSWATMVVSGYYLDTDY